MTYVDGFVLPVPKSKVAAYKRMSAKAGKIWREHGALEYRECAGDNLKVKMGVPFAKLAKSRPSETVVFSYIVYKSRAHRDKVIAKVMSDKRIASAMDTRTCLSIRSEWPGAASRPSSASRRIA